MQREIILECQNIYTGYYEKEILSNINMKLYKNEIVSLIGLNGSGKSTLFKVISGLLKPWKGKVIFKGKDIRLLNSEQRTAHGIGYMMQTENVFPSLTIEENLKLVSLNDKEHREEVLNTFDILKKKYNHRAGNLSGGERQILALSMILMRKPELLLLDEPTAGLAQQAREDFFQRIKKLKKKYNLTIFMIEQNIKQGVEQSNRTYVLKEGSIEEICISDKSAALSEIGKLFFKEFAKNE